VLREDIVPALNITAAEFAARVGLSEADLSALLLEKCALSPETARQLAAFLQTSPDSWLSMQEALDSWEARQQPA
jgi:addiction module HigA family antidote